MSKRPSRELFGGPNFKYNMESSCRASEGKGGHPSLSPQQLYDYSYHYIIFLSPWYTIILEIRMRVFPEIGYKATATNPSLPVIPCEDRCLDPQRPPAESFFRGSKHLLERYLENFGRLE